MSLPYLDDGHRLLVCLAIAIRRRDTVLIRQIAEKSDRLLSDNAAKRSFQRLRNYGVSAEDIDWLADCDL